MRSLEKFEREHGQAVMIVRMNRNQPDSRVNMAQRALAVFLAHRLVVAQIFDMPEKRVADNPDQNIAFNQPQKQIPAPRRPKFKGFLPVTIRAVNDNGGKNRCKNGNGRGNQQVRELRLHHEAEHSGERGHAFPIAHAEAQLPQAVPGENGQPRESDQQPDPPGFRADLQHIIVRAVDVFPIPRHPMLNRKIIRLDVIVKHA